MGHSNCDKCGNDTKMCDCMRKVRSPWTDDQVAALNERQKDNRFHPYTCPHPHENEPGGRELYADTSGWYCRNCTYHQDWAWGPDTVKPLSPKMDGDESSVTFGDLPSTTAPMGQLERLEQRVANLEKCLKQIAENLGKL